MERGAYGRLSGMEGFINSGMEFSLYFAYFWQLK